MRFHTALATVVLVLGVAAVVRATREQTEAAEAAEAAVEVDVQPQATVLLELSSLSAVYGAADRPRPKPGSAALNMAKYVDTNIKSSNQEEWGCCRVCDDLNDLVQKIPPALEPEYGHTVRDRRRHVAPERGFQEFAPPMVSCCPTCLWPPKLDPAAERTPTLQGDMETQMSTYGRGDGPRDAAVIAGAATSERVKEFAKFDAPNYRAPTEAMVTGMREREVKRRAARHAAEALLHARKYLNAEAIADAEAAVEANPMFLQVLAEVVADAEAEASAHGAYVDADADAEDAQAEADADAEGGAVADVDAEDADVEADAADLRMAQQHAVADAEAMSAADMEKFKLGKALKKVGKAAGKLVRKGLKGAIKLGKQLLKKFGKGLSKGLKDGAKEALGGAASAADAAAGAGAAANEQAAEEQSSDATEEGGERHRDGEEGAEEGADGEDGAGADAGAPAPPGGASLLPPSGLSPEERMEWVNARAERMEREAAERAAAHEQALRSGVPNVRSTAAAMQPHAAPVKPWNPLKDYRGDPMYYSLVTHPDVAYDDLGVGPKRAEELLAKRKPTPYLPPCCNMCGVNNGPRLTQPDRLSTCCYYCVRKPYGARPPRMRLRTSTRPEPKPKVTPETMARDLAAANARPQDDHADIFSPKPPMVHANRHRFG